MHFVRTLRHLATLALGLALLALGFGCVRQQGAGGLLAPLDLVAPSGTTTGIRLARLADDRAQCIAILQAASVSHSVQPPVTEGACPHPGTVRFTSGGVRDIAWRPDSPPVSCPVAATLYLWERDVVQPAALRHFGRRVAAIDHFGSYSCRRVYGREMGEWSEHASANAIDVAGFRLEGGQRIALVRDWNGDPAAQAFLREVRDGGCRLFATALSPDYNAAHADHFHFDQARRGRFGGRLCR